MRGARCNRSGANAGERSAAPEPKTATVERREASVPRHGTQGASLGAWRAALCARPTGAAAPERFSALRPPSFGVSEAKAANLGRRNASRERDGLFDMVNCCYAMLVLILRSAHVEDVRQTSNARARVSKDEEGCALMLRDGGFAASSA